MITHPSSGAPARYNPHRRGFGIVRIIATSCLMPALCATTLTSAQSSSAVPATAAERQFLQENDAVMRTMMAKMAIKPSGDVDRDFVEMMVPHHQAAVDMAVAVLRYGHNEKIRRLAQEIIIDQQQEIAAMKMAVGEPPPPSTPAPTMQSGAQPAMTPMEMPAK